MKIVDRAAEFTPEEKSALGFDNMAAVCERRACVISLNNLQTFPWVKTAMRENNLQVHAWYFGIGTGILEEYNGATDQFEQLLQG